MRRPKPGSLFSGRQYYRAPTSSSTHPASREERRQIMGTRQRHWRRLSRWLAVVLLVFGLWYFFTLSGRVTISSNQPSQESALRASVISRLAGLRRFKPWLNAAELTRSLRTEHPSLAQLRIYSTIASRDLYLSASFRQPVAVLISSDATVLGAVDQEGVVYAYVESELGNLPRIEESTELTPIANQPFITPRILDFVRLAETALTKDSPNLKSKHHFRLVSSTREVQLVTDKSYIVRLSIDRAAADQIKELVELEAYFKKAGRTPANVVDLRVDDTAYYR